MSGRRPRLLISVPNGTGWIHKHVVFALVRMLSDKRVESRLILPTNKPYVNNLHLVARDFLEGGFDFLLSIDDDNPPTKSPVDLVELDLDVVGFPTPVWHCDAKKPDDRPYYLNALRQVTDDQGDVGFRPVDSFDGFRPAGLQKVDAVGTGCVLIARRVLESLVARARELGPLESPFFRRWTNDGVVEMGNDYAFSMRAREAGFELFAHFDYPCLHFNELELTEMVNALLRFRLGR